MINFDKENSILHSQYFYSTLSCSIAFAENAIDTLAYAFVGFVDSFDSGMKVNTSLLIKLLFLTIFFTGTAPVGISTLYLNLGSFQPVTSLSVSLGLTYFLVQHAYRGY